MPRESSGDKVSHFLHERFDSRVSWGPKAAQIVLDLYITHKSLLDKNFTDEFCSGTGNKFDHRFSELVICDYLSRHTQNLTKCATGPDFLVTHHDRRTWIEVATPGPGDGDDRIPDDYLHYDYEAFKAIDTPEREIVLRIASAVRRKKDEFRNWMTKKIVAEGDANIIAVNSTLLDNSSIGIDAFYGPYRVHAAVRAVLPVGGLVANFDLESGKIRNVEHGYCDHIVKRNNSQVATDGFLSQEYQNISAIIAFHSNPYELAQGNFQAILIHNPLASIPLPDGLFKVDREYFAEIADDEIVIRWRSRNADAEKDAST